MITHYFRTVKDGGLKELEKPRSGVWTHVCEPSDENIQTLVEHYDLDPVVLEDARDFFEVPRFERDGDVTYFFTRYPYNDNREDTETAPLLIILGPSFVITVAVRDVPQFAKFFNEKEAVHTTQKGKFFIQILSAIIASYEKEMVRLRRSVHRDRAKLRHIGNREIERFVNYEHELNDIIAALVPTNTWLQQVTGRNFMNMYDDDQEMMEDLMIANSQVIDSARSLLKTIQNVRTASEAILTNNLNATIRTLTVLTILLTIPNIVSSLYGMNVPLPFMQSTYAFFGILLAILAIVGMVAYYFRRNKWL